MPALRECVNLKRWASLARRNGANADCADYAADRTISSAVARIVMVMPASRARSSV